ncbi:hypothetical protein Z043_115735, partial [Scleropages formosus]
SLLGSVEISSRADGHQSTEWTLRGQAMGCCSVTQRHGGTDEVGPDEIELLEIDGMGVWSLGESKLQISVKNGSGEMPLRCPSMRQLKQGAILWGRSRQELHHWIYSRSIRAWEGHPAPFYGEIVWSSLVFLHNQYTQERSERYLVLFSFHLLILALDNTRQEFIYEGILPLSGTSAQALSLDAITANAFELSGPMVESRVFICRSSTDRVTWLDSIEERRDRALRLQLSPSHSALSYLVPCDESWKKEELRRYLLRAPIWQWEGTPIQHMGPIVYLSVAHILNTQRQTPQERLLVLFTEDLLLLSIDSRRVRMKYEGRLPRNSIKALERSALSGRLEFELTGDLMDPLLVSCTSPEDYQNWVFQLQQ